MDRLTFEGDFCTIAMCQENPCPYDNSCTQREAWERLKAYEDTRLEPEVCAEYKKFEDECVSKGVPFKRVVELLEAEKDGRLVVLPCKVGDVVFGFHGEKTILPMVAKWIETNTDGWCIAAQYTPMAPKFYRFSDFGKTVFLTREEAEAALKGCDGE